MSKVHTLKIRINHLEDNPLHSDGTMTLQVLCAEVDDFCRTWEVCRHAEHDHDELDRLHFEEGEEEPFGHGSRHQYIDGDYMIPTERCYLQTGNDQVYHCAEDMLVDGELGAGDYEVEHVFHEGDLTEFELVRMIWPPSVAAS